VDFETLGQGLIELRQASWVDQYKPETIADVLKIVNNRIMFHLKSKAQAIEVKVGLLLASDPLTQDAYLALEEGAWQLFRLEKISTLDSFIVGIKEERERFKSWLLDQLTIRLNYVRSWCTPKLLENLHVLLRESDGSLAKESLHLEQIKQSLVMMLKQHPTILTWLYRSFVVAGAESNFEIAVQRKIEELETRSSQCPDTFKIVARKEIGLLFQPYDSPNDHQKPTSGSCRLTVDFLTFAEQVQCFLRKCTESPVLHDHGIANLLNSCVEEVACLLTIECMSTVWEWKDNLNSVKHWLRIDEIENLGEYFEVVNVVVSSCPNVEPYFMFNGSKSSWTEDFNSFVQDLQEDVQKLIWTESVKTLCRYYAATKLLVPLDVHLPSAAEGCRGVFASIRGQIYAALCQMAKQTPPAMLTHHPDQYRSDGLDADFFEFAHTFFDTGNAIIDQKFKYCIQQYRKCLQRRVGNLTDRIFDITIQGSGNLTHLQVKQFRAISSLVLQLKSVSERRHHEPYGMMLTCEQASAELNFEHFVAQIQKMTSELEAYLKAKTFHSLLHNYQLSEYVKQLALFAKIITVTEKCLHRPSLQVLYDGLNNVLDGVIEAVLQYFNTHNLSDYQSMLVFDRDFEVQFEIEMRPTEPKEVHAALTKASAVDMRFEAFVSRLEAIILKKVNTCIDHIKAATTIADLRKRKSDFQRARSFLPAHLCFDFEGVLSTEFGEMAADRHSMIDCTSMTAAARPHRGPRSSSAQHIVAKFEKLCVHSQKRALEAMNALLDCVQSNDECPRSHRTTDVSSDGSIPDDSVNVGFMFSGIEDTPRADGAGGEEEPATPRDPVRDGPRTPSAVSLAAADPHRVATTMNFLSASADQPLTTMERIGLSASARENAFGSSFSSTYGEAGAASTETAVDVSSNPQSAQGKSKAPFHDQLQRGWGHEGQGTYK
jgi:hypothetical protein